MALSNSFPKSGQNNVNLNRKFISVFSQTIQSCTMMSNVSALWAMAVLSSTNSSMFSSSWYTLSATRASASFAHAYIWLNFPPIPRARAWTRDLPRRKRGGLRLIYAPNVTRAYSKQSAPHENSAVRVAGFIINAHTYGVMLLLSCIDQYKESYPRIYSLFLLVGHLVRVLACSYKYNVM